MRLVIERVASMEEQPAQDLCAILDLGSRARPESK